MRGKADTFLDTAAETRYLHRGLPQRRAEPYLPADDAMATITISSPHSMDDHIAHHA